MNLRNPLFNFVLGNVVGIVFGASLAVRVVEQRTWKHIEQLQVLDAKNAQDARDLASKVDEAVQNNERIESEYKQRLEKCQSLLVEGRDIGERMYSELRDRDAHDRFFTLVYESEMNFAPTAQGQALAQVLNLYRPGLGTIVGRLQTPAQRGMQLRMVLRGYVRAEQLPPSVHLVYTLNPNVSPVQ